MDHKIKIRVIVIILILISFIQQPYDAFAAIIKQETSSDGIKTYYVSTQEENLLVFSLLKANMETEASVIYSGEMISLTDTYLQEAVKYNYTHQNKVWNTSYGIGSSYNYALIQTENRDGTITAKYSITYLENKDQTEYVYNTIRTAIKENISVLNTDYDKAYWAYHWVLDQVQYDFSYSKHSAYDGLQPTGTVCQGYATLYSAIANELGLECNFVSGTVGLYEKTNHAWNIVKLEGKWYCVDATWGDAGYGDTYFLRSKDTLATAEHLYHNSKLYDNYIEAGEDFATSDYFNTNASDIHSVLPSVYNIDMDVLKSNVLEVGEGYTFMINNKSNVPINFKSENHEIAKVDDKGIITGVKEGVTTVVAYNTELNIEQSCNIIIISRKDNSPALSVKKRNLKVGGKFNLDVNNILKGSNIKFVSSKPSIVKVNSISGKITAIKKGKSKITCTITNGTSVYVLKTNITVD